MTNMRRLAIPAALFVAAMTATPAVAADHAKVPVTGTWIRSYDFGTMQWTEKGPSKCLLEISADFEFSGGLTGTATGSYDVLIFAPCADAKSTPPGFFKDLYRFRGSGNVAVGGVDADVRLTYLGTEGPPLGLGEFEGMMVLTGDIAGVLHVEGSAAGDVYGGFVHTGVG